MLQDSNNLVGGSANGYVAGQIFIDIFSARYGSNGGGIVAMSIPAIAMLLCSMSSFTGTSR